jgi:hypothetical protein
VTFHNGEVFDADIVKLNWGGSVGQERDQLTGQAVLDRLKHLEPQQIAEVIDFIDFLAEKRQKVSPLVRLLYITSGPRVGLEEVRKRLAKIPGTMAETVRELRDERG